MHERKRLPGSDEGAVFLEYGLLIASIATVVALATTPFGLRAAALFAAAVGSFPP